MPRLPPLIFSPPHFTATGTTPSGHDSPQTDAVVRAQALTIRETVGDIKIAWASLGGARGRLTPKLLQTPCSEQMAVGLAPGSDVPVGRRGSRSPAAGVTARHSPPTVEGSRHASQPWN